MPVLYASGSLTLCTQIYRELAPLDRTRSQRIKINASLSPSTFASWASRRSGHRSHSRDDNARATASSLSHRTGGALRLSGARQRLCARTATSSLSCPVPPHSPSARSGRVARWGGERGLPWWGGRRGQPWKRARRNPARLGERKGRSWEGGRIGGADARVERKRGEGRLIFFILMGPTYGSYTLTILTSNVKSLYRTRVGSIHCGCPYCTSLLPIKIQTSIGNLHTTNSISITKVTSDATEIKANMRRHFSPIDN